MLHHINGATRFLRLLRYSQFIKNILKVSENKSLEEHRRTSIQLKITKTKTNAQFRFK